MVKNLLVLQRVQRFGSEHPYGGLKSPITPRNLTPSSDFNGYQAHIWFIYMQAESLKFLKNIFSSIIKHS